MSESEVLWQCLTMSSIIYFHSHPSTLRRAHVTYIQSNRTHQAVVLAGLGKEGGSFGWPETQENQDAADVGKLGLPEKEDSSTQRSAKQLVWLHNMLWNGAHALLKPDHRRQHTCLNWKEGYLTEGEMLETVCSGSQATMTLPISMLCGEN